VYKLWRPAPLYRAYALEKALQTPAKIYFKDESGSPSGSHKSNTAVAQAADPVARAHPPLRPKDEGIGFFVHPWTFKVDDRAR
jgi:threonine dehydratase